MKEEGEFSDRFSDDSKAIISIAKEVSYSLGSTTIEPIHLLLAELDYNHPHCIASHIFREQSHYDEIIQIFRVGEPIIIPQPEQVKKELSYMVERIIRKSYTWVKKLDVAFVEPYHMFIVLQDLDPNFFNRIIGGSIHFSCKEFYIQVYGLDFSSRKPGLLRRIIQGFKS